MAETSVHNVKPKVREHGAKAPLENSPGKLMSNFRNDSATKSPTFLKPEGDVFKPNVGSSKTFDFTDQCGASDFCDKCKSRMKLELKQSQNIPLTESEKRELNSLGWKSPSISSESAEKIEMMIFDVRYAELQEHGTLPNCFRFSLKEKLTEEDVNKFIEDYGCCKEAASTICILGAGNLTGDLENLNGVEKFHVKAVNKIISKMEK